VNFIYIETDNKNNLFEEKINKVLEQNQSFCLGETGKIYIDKRNTEDCFVETEDSYAYILGYIRDYRLGLSSNVQKHNLSAVSALKQEQWPLEEYTGSFSVFTINKQTQKIVIANDALGIYPLFYYQKDGLKVISSSLILISAIANEEIDYIGATERVLSREYCNFGKRTITKNVHRLLPGEMITLDANKPADKKYDNSLYRSMSKPDLRDIANRTWNKIEEEFALCFLDKKEIGLALSGGLDSRILLGAIGKSKKIIGLTYGDDEHYETKIAKQCADAEGIEFETASYYDYSFPSLELMEKYTLQTEAIGIQSWIALHERTTKLTPDSPYIIGDIFDGLTGKNIKTFKARGEKIKNFFKYMIFNRELPFTQSTPELFEVWKQNVIKKHVKSIDKVDTKGFDLSKDEIKTGVVEDLNELFTRISEHKIPYVELYDEIFGWYTHGRIPMAKQLLISKIRFFPVAPILSMQLYRHSSNIHPSLRLNFKMLDVMFKHEKLKRLANVPTAQIPWIPYRYNNLLKLFIWGVRSTLDQVLIKRQMKKKDVNVRHRILNTLNWVLAYRTKDTLENCEQWFEKDYVNKKDYVLKRVKGRAEMSMWPLSTADIVSASSVNIELSLIQSLKRTEP